jgi:uncharacterized RDD family membrane protein YckC
VSEGGLSPLPREARPYQGQRAGLVSRAVAAAIDGLLVWILLLLGYAAFAVVRFLLDPRGFSFPDLKVFTSLTTAFVVLVVYLTLTWWMNGRSYGCHVMGLRVVGPRGRNLRLPGALLRALFCAIFPIGIVWVAVSSQNRSVQDVVLRTSVIYDWQPTPGRAHPSDAS